MMMMVMTAMVSVAMHPPVFHSCESPAFSLKAALDDYHDWDYHHYIPIIVIEIIIFILIFIDRDYSENRDYEATKGSIVSTSLLVPKPNPTSCTHAHCASVPTLSIEAFSDTLPFYYFFWKVSAHLWEANIIFLIFYFFNDISRSCQYLMNISRYWFLIFPVVLPEKLGSTGGGGVPPHLPPLSYSSIHPYRPVHLLSHCRTNLFPETGSEGRMRFQPLLDKSFPLLDNRFSLKTDDNDNNTKYHQLISLVTGSVRRVKGRLEWGSNCTIVTLRPIINWE